MRTRTRPLLALVVVALVLPSAAPAQSGRRRQSAPRATAVPSLSTEDVVTAAPPVEAEPAEIVWLATLDEARRAARPDQVIFVSVHAPWCGWCKFMESRIYTDPEVQRFAARNIFVKVDAEDGGDGTRFARKVGVRSFPTLLVYSSSGDLVGRQIGAFRRPGDFLDWLVFTAEASGAR